MRVQPWPGEAIVSFYRRLCDANNVGPYDVWQAIRAEYPDTTSVALSPSQAWPAISELAGLPARYRWLNGTVDGCAHEPDRWVRRCSVCNGTADAPISMCRRCTAGELVLVYAHVGPICVKHARWHHGGLDIDIRGRTQQLNAQRRMSGALHDRTVMYCSRIATIAREILNEWWWPMRRSNDALSLETEIEEYPLLVDLLLSLTTPSMTKIMEHNLGRRMQAVALQRVAQAVRDGKDPSRVVAGFKIVDREFRATNADGSTSTTRNWGPVDPTISEALMYRMPTVRAGLLAHRSNRASWAFDPGPTSRRRRQDRTDRIARDQPRQDAGQPSAEGK